ncbi:N-acetylmuramoyl-L-alanine amidase family protein [Mucilaginibacter sp. E4BP6]|jgi:N-acetylmuramoyl-L-alanine amidase|uniref:N-acetylmuramoyl-L-alanine amidase family protein n=1 Tax=Mucilaginibacter sp. E4BP6 TaxID=2723089 RepID=UPI0015CA9DC8|nr:N-acetylmuramoyl-L-alanine amidase [Mucilaginibacter sp. E4BP6]NYE66474.1 N-acetylmuramoyl-L-alanine amidase [Mucilaginibacter sp. E4BP6]
MKNKILKRLICTFSLVLISFSLFSFPLYNFKNDTLTSSGYKLRTVIIDAGHGEYAPPGVGGHYSRGASGSYSNERDVTLAIALKLQTAIEKDLEGVKVVLTRNTSEDVSWEKRSEIANESHGDVFISIHCNSLPDKVEYSHGRRIHVPDRSGKGVLLLVYGFHRTKEEESVIRKKLNEDEAVDETGNGGGDPNDPTTVILMNAIKTKYRKQSIHLADLINTEFVDHDGRHSDGVIEQGVLVLCHSAMPSVLVETGFINNPDDEAYLNSESGQDEIVASLVRALTNYKKEVEDAAE